MTMAYIDQIRIIVDAQMMRSMRLSAAAGAAVDAMSVSNYDRAAAALSEAVDMEVELTGDCRATGPYCRSLGLDDEAPITGASLRAAALRCVPHDTDVIAETAANRTSTENHDTGVVVNGPGNSGNSNKSR